MRAVLAGLFLGVALFAGQRSQPKVYKIYVAEMHFPKNPDLDEFVRSKLISYLAQFCGPTCTVIDGAGSSGDDVAEKADGVLTGVVQIQETDQMRYRVQGAMRLVDKDGNVLWAATVYNSPFVRSATSSFAANTAKKLTTFLSRQ